MFSKFVSASLIGLSCLSLVAAAPFTYPSTLLTDGFPNPSAAQLLDIEVRAQGSLSNAAGGGKAPSADTITSLKLIAFNELSEVAFFTELLHNITVGVPGFDIKHDDRKKYILEVIEAVIAQEELHTINANNALKALTGSPIVPCTYNFPVHNVEEAIALAATFTDIVLGTLQDVSTRLGKDGDAGLIGGVVAVVGQEGEQNGFYRRLLNQIPSATPFLTAASREFAFSALNQNFVSSCPASNKIDLPIFNVLTIEKPVTDSRTQDVEFSIALPASGPNAEWGANLKDLTVYFINQQNVPIAAAVENYKVVGQKITFKAEFPYSAGAKSGTVGKGLTIAALASKVTPAGGSITVNDIAAAKWVFGPGLIELN